MIDYGKTKKKARPIIVKSARYNLRRRDFWKKRKLKGTEKTITESVTTKRIGQLNDAWEKYGFNNVWSYDGKILYKINSEVKFYCDEQLMAANVYGKICLWLKFAFLG